MISQYSSDGTGRKMIGAVWNAAHRQKQKYVRWPYKITKLYKSSMIWCVWWIINCVSYCCRVDARCLYSRRSWEPNGTSTRRHKSSVGSWADSQKQWSRRDPTLLNRVLTLVTPLRITLSSLRLECSRTFLFVRLTSKSSIPSSPMGEQSLLEE